VGLLKEIAIEQVAAKIGLFGVQGSGKSLTALLIAIGLSKKFHNGAPIAMHDTEGASDFLAPIAEIEGVKVLRHKSTSFADMVTVLREAESGGCCVFIQDTVSRTWTELVDAIGKKKNVKRLEFQHWGEVKSLWRERFVDRYMVSPLHCIVVGRAGDTYDTVEDIETGKRSQERTGTKMSAEKEFGYEPNLLIEMEGRRMPNAEAAGKKRRVRNAGGRIIHYAHVLKDRSRALNGLSLEFRDINHYKKGDYERVFDAFAPHWAFLNIGQAPAGTVDIKSNSAALFDAEGLNAPRIDWRQKREIAVEELRGILNAIYGGQDANSKQIRQSITFEMFDTYSSTAVENLSVERLEEAVEIMRLFKAAVATSPVTTPDDAVALVKMCRGRVMDTRAAVDRLNALTEPVTDDESAARDASQPAIF
jgi:hypothetical protein